MKRRGFSLIEMVLVITVTMLLTASIVFVYITCFRAWNSGEDRSQLRTEISLALERITMDLYGASAVVLESADSLKYTKGGTDYRFSLHGPDAPLTTYSLFSSLASEASGEGQKLVAGVNSGVFTYAADTKIVTVDLTGTERGSTIHMRTKIRPRNLE